MKTIGNILWFVLSGLWLAIGYFVAGLVCCITIIGIPFGIQAFKLAGFALWPFGRTVVRQTTESSVLETVFNVIWLLLFGWGLFIAALGTALLLVHHDHRHPVRGPGVEDRCARTVAVRPRGDLGLRLIDLTRRRQRECAATPGLAVLSVRLVGAATTAAAGR